MDKLTKERKSKFKVGFKDPTANYGVAWITFDPKCSLNFIPSTRENINTIERAIRYGREMGFGEAVIS